VPLSASLVGVVLLAALAPQAKPPSATEQKKLVEAWFGADWQTQEGRAERRRILAELERVPLDAASAAAAQKLVLERWKKGPELEKDSGQAYFWEEEKRGFYIVGGETKKPKALAICMHGGGAGSGDAWSAHGAYEPALSALDWLALYPEVLEKTEHGWTDSGTEEWVLELIERARRSWKIDPDRVYLGGPTPYLDRAGKVIDISSGRALDGRLRELDAGRAPRRPDRRACTLGPVEPVGLPLPVERGLPDDRVGVGRALDRLDLREVRLEAARRGLVLSIRHLPVLEIEAAPARAPPAGACGPRGSRRAAPAGRRRTDRCGSRGCAGSGRRLAVAGHVSAAARRARAHEGPGRTAQ
jgi:hypothetical protein